MESYNSSVELNSQKYWNERFGIDWNSLSGPEQSRYFAQRALSLLPRTFVNKVKNENLSILDWGCAEGEGTRELEIFFPASSVVGVDFSNIAILHARQKFPNSKFKSINYLTPLKSLLNKKKYDIVFSSNVFEHFRNPFYDLKRIVLRAKKFLIIMVPFEEDPLHEEHLFRFEDSNIPRTLHSQFKLVFLCTIDCSKDIEQFWGGQQVLLIYERF
jgi:hypothetical protein